VEVTFRIKNKLFEAALNWLQNFGAYMKAIVVLAIIICFEGNSLSLSFILCAEKIE
jgi:hypothetical protein